MNFKRQFFFLFYCFTETVRTDILVMSLQDLYSSSEFLLTILYPLLLGSSSSERWVWSHDRFLNKTAISLHCDSHSVLWCTCTPPDSGHFISLSVGMATLELGWSWSRRRKLSKIPYLLKHSMNLQCKLIVYTINMKYYNSFIGSECFKII